MNQVIKHSYLSGKFTIPPSKSDAQRAILCAALASGSSVIRNFGASKDVLSMIDNVQKIGAKLFISEDKLIVEGTSNFSNGIELNVGESGLGLRLLAGVCANQPSNQKLTGHLTVFISV